MVQADRRLRKRHPRQLELVDPALLAILREVAHGRSPWPLFLHGNPGTGKTCAGLALADRVRRACYMDCEEAADAIVRQDAPTWDAIRDCDLAILDELATRATIGDLHYQAVKRFCDLRAHAPALYISNVGPDGLARAYDERIASRVLCGTWHHLAGPDRRITPGLPAQPNP